MKSYCKTCSGLVDETEQIDGNCYPCNYNAMRSNYIHAGNILEEVHFKFEKIEQEFVSLKALLRDIRNLFREGWGVPE